MLENLLLKEQSHLMPGLMMRLLSVSASSTVTPLQGSPLMFHADAAFLPHLPRIMFSAATHGVEAPPTELRPRERSRCRSRCQRSSPPETAGTAEGTHGQGEQAPPKGLTAGENAQDAAGST